MDPVAAVGASSCAQEEETKKGTRVLDVFTDERAERERKRGETPTDLPPPCPPPLPHSRKVIARPEMC